MEEIRKTKKLNILTLVLFAFVFIRTTILIPENHFGITISSMQFVYSFESVLMWPLLIIYAALTAVILSKVYERCSDNANTTFVLLLADCVFFATLDDCLKLIVTILGLLCALNALKERPLLSSKITVPAFVFVSTLLMPSSALSFAALAFMIYILCNAENHSSKKNIAIAACFVCAAIGISVNLILTSQVQLFADFIDRFGFVDVVPAYKTWKILLACLPTALLSILFVDSFLKNCKKKEFKNKKYNSSVSADMIGLLYMFAVVGFIFFESEAFCTVNLVFPIAVIVSVLKKDPVTQITLSDFEAKISKHKIIAVLVLAIVFYCCFGIMDNYNDGVKIIKYIRY